MIRASWRKLNAIGGGPIAKATGVSLAIRLAGLALSFLQAVLTARLLGAGGYGTVAVVISIVMIVATLSQFGLGPLAVREVASRLAARDVVGVRAFARFAATTVILLSIAGGAALAVIASSGNLVPAEYQSVLGLGALAVLPFAFIGLFRGMAQGFGRIALAQMPGELVRPAGLILVMGVATLAGLSFSPADYIYVMAGVATIAAMMAGASLYVHEGIWLRGPASLGDRSRHAAASLPFLGLALTSMLQEEMNTLLLGWFSGSHETGLFQPVARLAPVLTLAVSAAGMRYAPRMAELWQRGEIERMRSVTAAFTWTTTLATLGIGLAIAASGPWLMLVFGSDFQQSAPLLWWVAAAQVFNSACGPVGMLLNMSGRSGSTFAGVGLALALQTAIGLVLIPTYGAWGAAVSLSLGTMAWNVFLLRTVRRHLGFNPSIVALITMP